MPPGAVGKQVKSREFFTTFAFAFLSCGPPRRPVFASVAIMKAWLKTSRNGIPIPRVSRKKTRPPIPGSLAAETKVADMKSGFFLTA